MESEWAHAGSVSDADFAFAFNDSSFSDMVLRLEIVGDSIHPQPDSEIADRARVRRREDIKKENDNTGMKELQADLKRNSDTIEKYYSDLQAQIDRLEVANTSRFERMEAINTSNEYKFNLINKALETLLQRNTPFQGSSHGATNSNKHQPFQVGNVKLDFPRFDVVDHAALPDGQILKGNQPDMADCVASENNDEEAVAMVEESPSVVDHAALPDLQILNGKQPDMDDCVASENKDEKAVAMVEESPSVVDHAAVLDVQILKGNQLDMHDCVSSENKDKEAVAMVEESASVVDHAALPDQQILNRKQPDMDDCVASENKDEKAVPMVEESPSGDEAVNSNDSNLSMDYSAVAVASVKILHINSSILADKSPFFCKLFSKGMREPEQRFVTLRIDASEEAALMELLKFMYSNTLRVNTETGLLEVLLVANKFEVASCMIYCSQLLQNMAMTPESALLYLELPSSVSMADAVQPLTDAAKQYLVGLYKDITKYHEEVMNFPLAGVEAILSSDDLQVVSEDVVYDFVLKWARKHYGNLEERQEVLGARLARLIRFPYMTCRKLKRVLTCCDFDHDVAFKHVLEALFFKDEAPHPQWSLAAEEFASSSRAFVERAYKYRRVKVVNFKLPRQQCEVYLDLKREECANLFPSGRLYSTAFKLGGQGFFLSAHCNMDKQVSFHCFGLFLGMQEKGSGSFTMDYEFAARSRPTEEFVSKYKGRFTFTGGKVVGYRNLFAIPWTSFMAEDCLYFINGVLHLRAVVTIIN